MTDRCPAYNDSHAKVKEQICLKITALKTQKKVFKKSTSKKT